MGGKYELRCFDAVDDFVDDNFVQYYNSWFKMRRKYRKKRKQYKEIYLIVRKELKSV